jgi:hypothetical protein
VLGSREGEFYFYAIDAGAPQLELEAMPRFVRPGDGPVEFTAVPPPSLTNVQLAYTTTMPGFILEEGVVPAMTYRYDAQRLAADFPNLDLRDAVGRTGVDTISITMFLSGIDESGVRRHLARKVVIDGEEVLMPEQNPSVPRRRAVRK